MFTPKLDFFPFWLWRDSRCVLSGCFCAIGLRIFFVSKCHHVSFNSNCQSGAPTGSVFINSQTFQVASVGISDAWARLQLDSCCASADWFLLLMRLPQGPQNGLIYSLITLQPVISSRPSRLHAYSSCKSTSSKLTSTHPHIGRSQTSTAREPQRWCKSCQNQPKE